MERWQIIYLILLAFGFTFGWLTFPLLGVALIWVGIIVSEIIRYRKELIEFEIKIEES